MEKYVIKDNYYFKIIEEKGRFVIIPNDTNINILRDILTCDKSNYYSKGINNFLNKEIPVSWINEKYIKDYDFVKQYNPEYLI